MKAFERRLADYIRDNNLPAEQHVFEESCHSVQEAAKAANAAAEEIIKNICFLDEDGGLIVAIVRGQDRASSKRIAALAGCRATRVATSEEIVEKSGYPCGGVPSFGFEARFLVDAKVMELASVYSGGGSPNALVKIAPSALLEANRGQVARIRR